MNGIDSLSFVILFGVFVGSLWGVSRVLSIRIRDGGPSAKLRRIALGGRIVLTVTAIGIGYVLYARYLPFESLIEVVLSEPGTGAGPVSTGVRLVVYSVGTGSTALAGVYVVDRELKPAVDEVLERTHTVHSRYRRRKWLAIAVPLFGLPAAIWFFASRLGSIPLHVFFSIALALVAVAWWLSNSFTVPFAVGTRDPTPAEQRRIERCYGEFDREPGTVVVVEESPVADVFAAGRGTARWTWIRESFLETADDGDLAVVLAQADEKTRAYFWELVTFALVALSAILAVDSLGTISAVSPLIAPGMSQTLLGILALSLAAVPRRCSYRADDFACSQFGAETVREVYRAYPDAIEYVGSDSIWDVLGHVGPEPFLERRLDRLSDRDALEPSTEAAFPSTPWTTVVAVCLVGGYLLPIFTVGYGIISMSAAVWLYPLLWLGVLVGIHLDSTAVRPTTGWPENPNRVRLAAAIPMVHILAGVWYLGKRRRVSLEVRSGIRAFDAEQPDHRSRPSDAEPIADDGTTDRVTPLVAVIAVCSIGVPLVPFMIGARVLSESIGIGAFLLLWIAFPLAVYLDTRTTRSMSAWPSYPKGVALASAVPYLNTLVGLWYLSKRRNLSNDEPPATDRPSDPLAAPDESTPATESAPDADFEQLLSSMTRTSFTRFVADLRSSWGWHCDLTDDGSEREADIVATDPSEDVRTLIRTVHRSTDRPVTRADLDDVDSLLEAVRNETAASVVVVTNGRFAADVRAYGRDQSGLTLVDGSDLIELIEEAEATSLLETYAALE